MRKLTARQENFVQYYYDIGSDSYGNATQSAIKAGYPENGAEVRGSENVRKSNIIEAGFSYKAAIAEKIEINRQYLVDKLEKLIAGDTRDSVQIAAIRTIADLKGFNTEAAPNKERQAALARRISEDDRRILLECSEIIMRKKAETGPEIKKIG